jgi:medium-chain acyl-[acyl-carrier-protein] hydrolase
MIIHRNGRQQERWLNKPLQQNKVNLVCFPFAGGGASVFNTLAEQLPELNVCSVQYPGRDARIVEPRYTHFKSMHNRMAEALIPQLMNHQVILYGHSLGAWLAWVIAQELEQLGAPVLQLVVAAQRAPSCLYPYSSNSELTDRELEQALGVTFAPEIIANPQLKRLFLQVIRDDLTLCETFAPDMSVIDTPLTIITAQHDHIVNPAEALAWKRHCKGTFAHHAFDAKHLFIDSHLTELCSVFRHISTPLCKTSWACAS